MSPLRLTTGVPGGVAGGVSGRRGQGRVCGLAGALRLLGINLEDPSVELRDIEYAMQYGMLDGGSWAYEICI